MKQSPEQLSDFVEEMGVLLERLHFSKMSGRILGWLLATKQTHTSFDDLVQVLSASKSSISTNLKLLQELNFISPYTQHGDRKTYYRFNFQGFFEAWQARMNNTATFCYLFQKAALLYPNGSDDRALQLAEQAEFYTWLDKEQGKLFKLWQNKKKEASTPNPPNRAAPSSVPSLPKQEKRAAKSAPAAEQLPPTPPKADTKQPATKEKPEKAAAEKSKQTGDINMLSLFD